MGTAPTEVHPELRDAWEKAPKLPYHKLRRIPLMRRATAALVSAADPVDGICVDDVDAGSVLLRVYRPTGGTTPRGGLLWMHGGGLLLGRPAQDDARCSSWAKELGVVVASVYYRFAPEHPFPAAADDCLEGWRWLQGQGLGRLVVGGVSAGGGLAATLCQRLRSEGGAQPSGQLLLWPMLDDRTGADETIDPTAHIVWNNQSNAAAWGAYLGCPPGAQSLPEFSVAARCTDLQGLPPTWIGFGALDLFAQESRTYGRRLHEAGVPVTVDEVLGAFHDFVTLAPDASPSRQSVARQTAFLRTVLGAQPNPDPPS